ncbi:MAG: DNA helicase PcrA [Bacillota bacterium]|jgi:DNA helicase-2/ATP-dependent DNA helicase PcrA|nr:DNA helicase PcrA [Bacillota bacterium]HHU30752.1 DNA helicase PcrA [Bacillota bacterium]
MSFYLDDLNENQRKAVECTEGPLLVLAGAGSGKTRVITCRIAYLIEQGLARPWEILALTFTNKAAEEMRVRVSELVGNIPGMWVSTFHSAAVRILRENAGRLGLTSAFTIYDGYDQLTLVRSIINDLMIKDSRIKPRGVLAVISRAKNELTDEESYALAAADYYTRQVSRIYRRYQERLRKNNALDFDDLLLYNIRLFKENPDLLAHYREKFRYILVDEYQDTNRVQYEIVRLLAEEHRNICVVGDDDQSIYQFRGADIRNILDFERDWPEAVVVKLEENYRSTGNILEAANHVVKNNAGRKEKKLWTRKEKGEPVTVFAAEDEKQEARFIAREIRRLAARYNKFAVLYRTNAQSRVLEDAMLWENISYQIVGGVRFWERKEIKDIIAYLRVLANPTDDLSLQRIINVPRRGIGAVTLERLRKLAAEKNVPLSAALSIAPKSNLGSGHVKKVQEFAALLADLRKMGEYLAVDELAEQVMVRSGYLDDLRAENTEEARSREENLYEFLTVAREFLRKSEEQTLDAFLAQLSLLSDLDTLEDEGPDVLLMTLHSAKGLEFPVVFIAGLEEGLFPHKRSLDTADGIEEERRLCYVGITRAQEVLYLTYAQYRNIFGSYFTAPPSRFIGEIPETVLSGEDEVEAPPDLPVPGEAGDVETGDRVEHARWGVGEVRSVDSLSDGDRVLTIFFPSLGLKKVIARYAPLRKIK